MRVFHAYELLGQGSDFQPPPSYPPSSDVSSALLVLWKSGGKSHLTTNETVKLQITLAKFFQQILGWIHIIKESVGNCQMFQAVKKDYSFISHIQFYK